MRLIEMHVDGFGKLREQSFAFDPRLTVVYGANEAGKSTLAGAIVATLYGPGRKRDVCRPWGGGRYAARLHYALASGREYEVAREFDDARAVRVRNQDGEEVTADVSNGKAISPGAVHLGIPLEVFLNASCVRQGAVEIDAARADAVGAALARALDGGPKEDAAIGALQRLEKALAEHVGTKRATVNVPLRRLQERAVSAITRAEVARERLREQDDLRRRLAAQRAACETLANETRVHERNTRSARAAVLRGRLESLRQIRDELASLHAQRAEYDDVTDFPKERVGDMEERFARWQERETFAAAAQRDEAAARMTAAEAAELDARMADGGALDDAAFARLQDDAKLAGQARDAAAHAAEAAAAARRAQPDDGTLTGAALSAAVLLLVGSIVLAILHIWLPATEFAAPAAVCAAFVAWRLRRRRSAVALVRTLQSQADAASAAERDAARAVAETLARFRVASFEDLAERRRRARELQARSDAARTMLRRRDDARTSARDAANAFDELASVLAPTHATPDVALAEAKRLAARRTAREGIEARLHMLQMARESALGSDDEVALERELEELIAAGAVPTAAPDGASARRLENEQAALIGRLHAAQSEATELAAELRAAEASVDDLAELDEEALALRAQIERLQRFERTVSLARRVIDERMREAHEKFARRLADYATDTFARVTAGRYTDLRVAPTTLQISVRLPETGEIHDLDDVSAGTREQAYLILRLAMARMFAEGSEVLPILLDDPFVSWDAGRIERALPVLHAATKESQVIIFTASDALARAAAANGAARIDLEPVAAATGSAATSLRVS